MTFTKNALWALQLFSFACAVSAQDFIAPQIKAPPTAPPLIESRGKADTIIKRSPSGGTLYSIGEPTDEEQLYLEYVNRARTNATAEANRILALNNASIASAIEQFGVDTNLMKAQFATNPPVAPLSFNAKLINAARGHSQYQFNNGIQTHFEGTVGLADRFTAAGYAFSTGGENVYAYAEDVEQGHAGFEIDWGGPVGGMQSPPGHRDSIHNGRFVEVGVGIVKGTNVVPPNDPVGPMVVTEDFGAPLAATTYITGVAYYDLNGNNFYDLGEGLGGVTVTVDASTMYAITSASGGYSIPVPPNQTHTVRFNVAGAAETVRTVTVGTANVKVDFLPAFVPTVVTSAPSIVFVGTSNAFRFATLPGATAYRARSFNAQPAPVEGAETLTNTTITSSPGYTTTTTTTVSQGAKAFHLAHVTDATTHLATAQYIQFKSPYLVGAGGKITMQSLLGLAYQGETAKVEVSTDEGATWAAVYKRQGNKSGVGDTIYSPVMVDLAAYVGKTVMLRLNYDVDISLGWYNVQNDSFGWFIDAITFSNVTQLTNPITTNLDLSGGFGFKPTTAGNYLLQFQAVNGTRSFPWGPATSITAQSLALPVLTMKATTYTSGQVTLNFERTSGTATAYAVDSAATVIGPWLRETGAVVTPLGGTQFSASVTPSGTIRFYRVLAN